jgi:hypothetical protein
MIGGILSDGLRLGLRAGASPGVPLMARVIVIGSAAVIGLGIAVLIMRTCLVVSTDGLADHRIFRVIRIPWEDIAAFEIDRPKGLWGGFCITAVLRNGASIDLMSTRVYSRIPSGAHVDELYRISWTLEEAAGLRAEQTG